MSNAALGPKTNDKEKQDKIMILQIKKILFFFPLIKASETTG